jgi:hypothetical protein
MASRSGDFQSALDRLLAFDLREVKLLLVVLDGSIMSQKGGKRNGFLSSKLSEDCNSTGGGGTGDARQW